MLVGMIPMEPFGRMNYWWDYCVLDDSDEVVVVSSVFDAHCNDDDDVDDDKRRQTTFVWMDTGTTLT